MSAPDRITAALADRRLVLHTDSGLYVTDRLGRVQWMPTDPDGEADELTQLAEWLEATDEPA